MTINIVTAKNNINWASVCVLRAVFALGGEGLLLKACSVDCLVGEGAEINSDTSELISAPSHMYV